MNNYYLLAVLSITISAYSINDSSFDLLTEHKELVDIQPNAKVNAPVIIEAEKVDLLQLIPFSFKNEKLIDIITYLQKYKNVNIILPQGNAAIKPEQTITFSPAVGDKLTLEAAWEMLFTFLDLSGYSMIQGDKVVTIVKNDERLVKDVLPVYITPLSQLPYSEERIRFVYYFKNLKMSDEAVRGSIDAILKEMLSPQQLVLIEPKANAIIITDKSDLIISAMRIINELDISGFQETVQVMPLYYATASDVKIIFDALKLASNVKEQAPGQTPFLRGDSKAESSTYFPTGTNIQIDPRTNSLIIMGKATAISRIQDFIEQYIDIPPAAGKSILHVVNLNYLDAQTFAVTLANIVERQGIGDQSKGGGAATGPEKFFGKVVIKAEPTINTTNKGIVERTQGRGEVVDNSVTLDDSVYSGGNRLIIAALEDDWKRIRDLIERLDNPQPQVMIDVFIADVQVDKTKIIASTTRNLLDCDTDNWVDYLSSQLSAVNDVLPVVAATNNNGGTLAVDLLEREPHLTPPNPFEPLIVSPGSFVLSFNQNCTGIWALLQILDKVASVNVISRPHIVTLNNQIGKVSQSIIRRALGQPYASNSGTPVTPFVDIQATISMQIRPRVAYGTRVALEIAVNISQFATPNDNATEVSKDRIERNFRTNACLNSGQVLIIGGLTRRTVGENDRGTPILERIPFIGWLFKRRERTDENLNIAVFIAPTIIEPKLRDGLDFMSEYKTREGREDFGDDNTPFNNPKDPITRFFFTDTNEADLMTKEYISRASNAEKIDPSFSAKVLPKRNIKILTRENMGVNKHLKANALPQLVA